MTLSQSGVNQLLVVSYIGLWIIVVLLLVTVFALARQIALLHRRIPAVGARMTDAGPEIGIEAPKFQGVDFFGKQVSLGHPSKKRTLLLFVSPSCPACGDTMTALRSIKRSEKRSLDIVLVSLKGNEQENLNFVTRYAIQEEKYLRSGELGDLYQISSAPYGVLIGTTGTVRSKGIVNHLEHLESLLNADEIGEPSMEQFLNKSHYSGIQDANSPQEPLHGRSVNSQSSHVNGGQRNG